MERSLDSLSPGGFITPQICSGLRLVLLAHLLYQQLVPEWATDKNRQVGGERGREGGVCVVHTAHLVKNKLTHYPTVWYNGIESSVLGFLLKTTIGEADAELS